MKHVVNKVEILDSAIYMSDTAVDGKIKIVETPDGADLLFSSEEGFFIVDSKTLLGSLRALVSKGERDRLNKQH